MKKLWVLGLILCLALFACELEERLQAEFEIIYMTQVYYESLEYWGSVEIEYTIENTGSLCIDSYYVYFEIACEGGAVYSDYDWGYNISVGQLRYIHVFVPVGNKEALTAKITGSELSNYDW